MNSVVTIKRWFVDVAEYFQSRTTNGIVEKINNKLKLLKGCGSGFTNFNIFQIPACLFWHNANI
ncbi:transposase [Microcoleus sp. AR_TQ3_B6]|uniref:transposase n=1 Tax=Microcoleus sp. AR_TQ3_B6 TaxID=3055284 RepID=UPI00403F8CA3